MRGCVHACPLVNLLQPDGPFGCTVWRQLNQADGDRAEKLGLKDHLLPDIHIGGGGAVEVAEALFAKNPNWTMGAINCETNAGIHTMSRALMEVRWPSSVCSTHHAHSGDALARAHFTCAAMRSLWCS